MELVAHPAHPGVTKSYDAFTKEEAPANAGFEKATGGNETHKLMIAEMPVHDHEVYQHAGYRWVEIHPDKKIQPNQGAQDGDTTTYVHGGHSDPAGGDQAFDIRPPYIALYYCKRD